jgi:hypothetical protein
MWIEIAEGTHSSACIHFLPWILIKNIAEKSLRCMNGVGLFELFGAPPLNQMGDEKRQQIIHSLGTRAPIATAARALDICLGRKNWGKELPRLLAPHSSSLWAFSCRCHNYLEFVATMLHAEILHLFCKKSRFVFCYRAKRQHIFPAFKSDYWKGRENYIILLSLLLRKQTMLKLLGIMFYSAECVWEIYNSIYSTY